MRRIAVRGIIMLGDKLLCVRLKPYKGSTRSQNSDFWCLPGGGLEDGETLIDGIVREMVEETGIKPVVGKLLYVQQYNHGDNEFLEFFFHITNVDDYTNVDLSKASHGEEEIAEIAFIDPKSVRVLPEFLSTEPLQSVIATTGAVR